jgi:hypothetical protein
LPDDLGVYTVLSGPAIATRVVPVEFCAEVFRVKISALFFLHPVITISDAEKMEKMCNDFMLFDCMVLKFKHHCSLSHRLYYKNVKTKDGSL